MPMTKWGWKILGDKIRRKGNYLSTIMTAVNYIRVQFLFKNGLERLLENSPKKARALIG